MSAAEDVAEHIYGSLLDLRRRLDTEVAIEVARAVVDGASRALGELTTVQEDRRAHASDPASVDAEVGSARH